MRKSFQLFLSDQELIRLDSYAVLCRNNNPCVLVRRRKMPLEDLIYSMINRKGLTLKLELRNYMKIGSIIFFVGLMSSRRVVHRK